MCKNEIFNILENIIRKTTIDDSNIYEECSDTEKLQLIENNDNSISYKILKNNILLKYSPRKKTEDLISIRIYEEIISDLELKISNIKIDSNLMYAKFNVSNIEDINKINEEIQFVFKKLFIDYIKSNLSFGCCSRYIECSDSLKCVNPDIKLKLGCQYKTNLDNKRIFYGKNSIIK